MSNGFILYEGPSLIDGAPIVMIGTGFWNRSNNRKTGDMIQTWILRQDIKPTEAIKSDLDYSICGSCKLRGTGAGKDRACYVNVGQAPNRVWGSYKRGNYKPLLDPRLVAGRALRLGSYGDPAAVPLDALSVLVSHSAGSTGYTHQWRTCDQRLSEFVMASCDCVDDYFLAKSRGWRTFRVHEAGAPRIDQREIVCPASVDSTAERKLTCAECLACDGSRSDRRSDIRLSIHGSAAVTTAYHRAFKGIPLRVAA